MMNKLPRICVVDDQYGRCGLGKAFSQSLSPDILAAYRADRRNLCQNYGIFDLSGDSKPITKDDAQCEALFCPAQRWDDVKKRIENDLDIALQSVTRGWPFPDGSRWALILLDLAFVQGTLDVFGDPQERTYFGRDTILAALKRKFGDDLPIVVLSSTPKDEHNEAVRRGGGLDFIQRIPNSIESAGNVRQHLADMLYLHGLVPDATGLVAGTSLPTLKMLRQARRAARNARTILLHGEIGTGKNLLARYIQDVSPRRDKPFEVFNAANRSADLQADELFGHWKGAFTGAISDAPGIWERCNGGVVLIDEVADLDVSVQQKLMAPIEDRQVVRVGSAGVSGGDPVDVDVLTLLATNRDVNELTSAGAIKKDFLSRINATVIEIPPLRERRDDIPAIIEHLVSRQSPQVSLLPDAVEALCKADWKDDNIRGLRRVIEQLAVSHPGQVVTARDVESVLGSFGAPEPTAMSVAAGEPDEAACVVERYLKALQTMPDQCSREDCRRMMDELRGVFPDVAARILAWSLQLCGDVTNTARFLSGNDKMDTSAAKQFVKKIIKLDIKNGAVLKAFAKYPESEDAVIKELINEKRDEPR